MGRSAADLPDPAAEARWLLVECRSDGSIRYALSNLPATATLAEGVRVWKSRWQVEQGYQQLKEELGLDHFEGRSWPGFHHHAALCFLAYGFLALKRSRGTATSSDEPIETTSPLAHRHLVPSPGVGTSDSRCQAFAAPSSAGSNRHVRSTGPWCQTLDTSGFT